MEDTNLIWFDEAPVPERFFYGPAFRKAREEWNRDRSLTVLKLLRRKYRFNLLWQSPPKDPTPLRIRLISARGEELTLQYHPGIQNFQVRYEIEKSEYRGDPRIRFTALRHCHLAQPEENDADSCTTTDPETVPEGGDAHGDERAP